MNEASETSNDAFALTIGIVTISALAWLLAERIGGFEQTLSHSLFGLASQYETEFAQRMFGTELLRVGIICGFASAGTIVAYKVSDRSITIVFVQLIALNLVLHLIQHIVVPRSDEALSMPISLAVASTCGLIFGCFVKSNKHARNQLAAKDAALETLGRELTVSKLQIVRDDEVERRILAADLHDQVLNDLKLLREKVKNLPGNESANGKQAEVDSLIERSMLQIREVMDSLSPAVLQHLGFVDALEDCVRNGSERGEYKVRFRCSVDHSEFDSFSETEQTLLYRLVQESVTNICKHSEAKTVKCVITMDSGNLAINIIDDGKGMNHSAAQTQSRGLKYMQQRASLIGATVKWHPGEDNKGTRVEISIRKPEQSAVRSESNEE